MDDLKFYMKAKASYNLFYRFETKNFFREIHDLNVISAYHSHEKLIMVWK